jgi:transcription-repair coupling factor (superfamily II helicase)
MEQGIQQLKEIIAGSEFLRQFQLPAAGAHLQIMGMAGSLRAFLFAHLATVQQKRVVFVTADSDSGERLRDDLELLAGAGNINFFPAAERLPYDDRSVNPSMVRLRLETMQNLLADETGIIVCTVPGLMSKVPSGEHFVDHQSHIEKGRPYSFDSLVEELSAAGYERCEFVEDVGHFAVRGGLLDVYPWTMDEPVRIEFFGNEVESIRIFNVVTQRSVNEIEKVVILPNRETGERLIPLHELFSANSVIVFEEYEAVLAAAAEFRELAGQRYAESLLRSGSQASPDERYIDWQQISAELSGYPVLRMDMHRDTASPEFRVESRVPPTFAGQLNRFFAFLRKNSANKEKIIILCDVPAQTERMIEILEEEKLDTTARVFTGALHNGFSLPEASLHVLTDHEVFDRFKRRKTYRRFKNGEYLRSLNSLNLDDFVVHIDYGVGKYRGLHMLEYGNSKRECIKLEYADGDTLFVSVDRLNRVQKFSSDEGVTPKITKLGGGEWERLKKRTSESVKKIAGELIQLYAARKLNPGHAFKPDSHWQRELEASFPYEETEDQLRSIEEVKRDLESVVPMDRLLCGDVGYGKTEVALRAAFKAVNEGRQVALLVPTTILAYQHYQTFRDRMSDFPVNVAMLSRFRTPKQQKESIAQLEEGKIDIIIGTHRLLSEDIKFRDLGLLIIDEEQRFGVKHKERLKQMRISVDVLTMTATPIPRTMHMALMGARDLSNIETPPRNRLPVVTEVHQWDEDIIQAAVRRELQRKGQVYFVHNRVQSIDNVAEGIREIVPEARIAVAHGQLPERQLEKIMMAFVHREYDVLISTMIIENGLDIPNVNTIIVDHADKFGLAQLYQLRGRVGRSDVQAYAYLLTPSIHRLTDLARKRLRAIQDFTDLGSGFKVALRDMEIRGIGNMLGKEQSGYIQGVGFDLYCKILDDAVQDLKAASGEQPPGEVSARSTDPKLDVDFDLFLPASYIATEAERVTIYHRMVNFRKLEELESIKEELKDRFGPPPAEMSNLVDIIEVKVLAGKLLASHVIFKEGVLGLSFSGELQNDHQFFNEIFPAITRQKITKMNFKKTGSGIQARFDLRGKSRDEQLEFAKNLLQNLT